MLGRNSYDENGEAVEQVAQRNLGCLIPGSIQGHVVPGFK